VGIESGADFFYLEVRKSNIPAINLYKRFGFEIISIRKEYYSDNKEDALVMALKI
jgi:ribosomal-protein-alanine N-acetyltransferase